MSTPLEERFFSKVNKNTESGCHEWTASTCRFGYGRFRYKDKNQHAHRIAYMIHLGDINTPMLCVLHKCDNPKCVNPDHLFLGTKKDNSIDMVRKFRFWRAKVTAVEAQIIFEAAHLFKGRLNHIADYFKISRTHVSGIKTGRKHSYVNN